MDEGFREELQLRYNGERFYYMTRSPETRLQLDADALHDTAQDMGIGVEEAGNALGLIERDCKS